MRKIHPFFLMGTVGMFVAAVVKMLLPVLPENPEISTASSLLYPIFLLFLLAGTAAMINKKDRSAS